MGLRRARLCYQTDSAGGGWSLSELRLEDNPFVELGKREFDADFGKGQN
jgi:hypothetical protein